MYRIKCYRLASSRLGAATSYLKRDGVELRLLTLEQAEEELAKVRQTMGSNPNLAYEIEELP